MQNSRQNNVTTVNGSGATVRKRALVDKQQFLYDEMVMSSNGTRYYIRYLDRDTNQSNGTTNTTTVTRQPPPSIGSTTITRRTIQMRGTGRTQVTRIVQPTNGQSPNSTTTRNMIQTQMVRGGQVVGGGGIKRKATDTLAQDTNTQAALRCDICHKQFQLRSALTMHMQDHKDAMATCPCGRRFAGRQFMLRHQQQRLQSEGVSCEAEAANKSTSIAKESESAREILRRGLSGLKAAAVPSSSDKTFEIELSLSEEDILKKWIQERYAQSKQPVRPGEVFRRVKTMNVPTGIGVEHFYRWLRKYLERHTEIKDMVIKVLAGPKSAQEKVNKD